jgi:hypothetical protein
VSRRRLLSHTWSLGDVDDVEAFCGAALDRWLRRYRLRWTDSRYEDMLADLLGEAWRLWSEAYDEARGLGFASYASFKLRCYLIDHSRRELARGGGREGLANALSLDELAEVGGDSFERSLAASAGDSGDPVAALAGRLLANRDLEDLRGAAAEVALIARTPKGVSRLLRDLRAELEAQRVRAALSAVKPAGEA